jgi:hypothetical protein
MATADDDGAVEGKVADEGGVDSASADADAVADEPVSTGVAGDSLAPPSAGARNGDGD